MNHDTKESGDNTKPEKKLSKEFYIELAAFSDSIYDRGKD